MAGSGLPIASWIGGIFGAVGQRSADIQQAGVEKANSIYYKKQAGFIKQAGKRELSIFDRDIKDFEGKQSSSFAKAGVDMSGSALNMSAQTKVDAAGERVGIRDEYSFREYNARMNSQQAAQRGADGDNETLAILKGVGSAM